MPPRKRVNQNFVQPKAISSHSMNLRSRSIARSNGNTDTKLATNGQSGTLRTRKPHDQPKPTTSKTKAQVPKVVKNPQPLKMNLRSRSNGSCIGNSDTKLATNGQSGTLRTRKPQPKPTTSKTKAQVQKVVKKPQPRQINLRSKSIVCNNGDNIGRCSFVSISATNFSMKLRSRKCQPTVVTTSKAKAQVQKVAKKPRKSRKSQIETRVEPLQVISVRITTFDDLTDDCILLIFGKFGIQELMFLRPISTRCLSIIVKIFLGIRSLKLFVGHYSVYEYLKNVQQLMLEDDDFRLKPNEHSKNDDLVLNYRKITNVQSQANYAHVNPTTFLPHLFPNVNKLFISLSKEYREFNPDDNLDYHLQIAYFHEHFFDFSILLQMFGSLTTLFVMNPSSYKSNLLWHKIASKRSLRSLYLISIGMVFHIPKNIYHNLQQLTIVTCDKAGMDFVLPHLEPNCTQLAFYWRSWETEQLQDGLDLNPNLLNTITHFSIGPQRLYIGPNHLLISTCAQLKSLKFLRVSLLKQVISLKGIFTQLASLPQLAELRLLDLKNEHLETDESEVPSFLPLPLITNLFLGLSYDIYALNQMIDFNTLQYVFKEVFPSLRQVTVLCENQTILNQSRECFTDTRFPHLRQSSFYANFDAMFERSKYLGRHYNNNFGLIDLDA